MSSINNDSLESLCPNTSAIIDVHTHVEGKSSRETGKSCSKVRNVSLEKRGLLWAPHPLKCVKWV